MDRVYHPWDKWECYRAGFFENSNPNKMKNAEAEEYYKKLLTNLPLFEETLKQVIENWPYSCEHNLTNEGLNRVAWLGQACVTYKYGISGERRAGFGLLTEQEQQAANALANKYLEKWVAQYLKKQEKLCQS